MTLLGIVLVVGLFLTGSPLFVAFGLGSTLVILQVLSLPMATIAQHMFSTMDSYVLMAVPFFMFAGNLMTEGKSSEALVDFAENMLGHLPGGVLIAGVAAGAIMGAVVGQGWASVVAVGSIVIPKMVERGYGRAFSAAVIMVSANLGSLIPPSVSLILFSAMAETSGAKLFAAGLLPGLLTCVLIAVLGAIICKKRGISVIPAASWSARWAALRNGFFALMMPVFVLGAVYTGTFTPTEAAALSSVYAALIGAIVYRGLTWSIFLDCAVKTARTTCMVYFLLASVSLLNVLLTFSRVPEIISGILEALDAGPYTFLCLLSLVIIIAGFFAEALALLFLIAPLFLPAANILGISALQFGPLLVLGILIGQVTPPMGPLLYFTSGVFKVPSNELVKASIPFLIVEIVGMLLIIYWPGLTTWLPSVIWR